VSAILTAAFHLYRQHWQALVTIVAIVAIPLSLLQYFIADRFTAGVPAREDAVVVSGDLWRAVAANLTTGVLSILIVQLLTGAITRAAAGTLLGEDLTFEAAYSFGYARLWSILLVTVLVGLAVTAGFIVFIIPGFFVLVRLIASLPALVVEGKRGRAALSRSWDLVRGRGWPVLGALLAAAIITGVVISVITAPITGSWLARGLAGGLASVVTMPFSTLVLVLLYLDLRVRKERLDLETLRRDLAASAP